MPKITDVAQGPPSRKDIAIAEGRGVLGVCLVARNASGAGSYSPLSSGSVVRGLIELKEIQKKVYLITSDNIVSKEELSKLQRDLKAFHRLTGGYRLYFKQRSDKAETKGQIKEYDLGKITSADDEVSFVSGHGVAIIPIDSEAQVLSTVMTKPGILDYRPFSINKEEPKSSNSGDKLICQIVDGSTNSFAVTPYNVECINGEYCLKLPEQNSTFRTLTELRAGSRGSLRPNGAVILKTLKIGEDVGIQAVGVLNFVGDRVSPVWFSQLQVFGTVDPEYAPSKSDQLTSTEDLEHGLGATGTTANQDSISDRRAGELEDVSSKFYEQTSAQDLEHTEGTVDPEDAPSKSDQLTSTEDLEHGLGLRNIHKRSLAKETEQSESDAIQLAGASKVPSEVPPHSIEGIQNESAGSGGNSGEVRSVVTGRKSCKNGYSAKTGVDHKALHGYRDNSVEGKQGFHTLKQMRSGVDKSTTLKNLLTKLEERASENGFTIVDKDQTGNCLFASLSDQLELVQGRNIGHEELRQSIVKYLRQNPKWFSRSVCGQWENYLTKMEKDGEWGDHLTLQAAADLFEITIYVINSESRDHDVTINPRKSISSKHLVLGHVCELHYVSLRPKAVAPELPDKSKSSQGEPSVDVKQGSITAGRTVTDCEALPFFVGRTVDKSSGVLPKRAGPAQRGTAQTPSSLVINERENASKLNTLLVEGGSEALTRVFNTFHPPENLQDDLIANKSTLKELLDRNILNERQWDKLFPPNGDAPDAGTFDFTLLFFLLKTICGLPPASPDECSKPPQRHTSVMKNIHNLRRLHDELYVSKDRIDTPTFNVLWDNISSILVNLGLKQSEIDNLKKPYEEEKKEPPLSSGRLNSGEMESSRQRLTGLEEANEEMESFRQRLAALEEANEKVLRYIQERDNYNAKDYLPTAGNKKIKDAGSQTEDLRSSEEGEPQLESKSQEEETVNADSLSELSDSDGDGDIDDDKGRSFYKEHHLLVTIFCVIVSHVVRSCVEYFK